MNKDVNYAGNAFLNGFSILANLNNVVHRFDSIGISDNGMGSKIAINSNSILVTSLIIFILLCFSRAFVCCKMGLNFGFDLIHILIIMVMEACILYLLFYLIFYRNLRGYHAAEHATINLIEKKENITLKNLRAQSLYHVRCESNTDKRRIVFPILFLCLLLIYIEPLIRFGIQNYWFYLCLIIGGSVSAYYLGKTCSPFLSWRCFEISRPSKAQYMEALAVAKEVKEWLKQIR